MKKRKKKQSNIFQAIIPYTLVLFVLIIGYGIFYTDLLNPKLNEITASYISFNNNSTTDMLKINNLKKYSDNNGISYKNKSYQNFCITGKTDNTYQIVLYHMGNSIDDGYVKFQLTNEKNKSFDGVISNIEKTQDGGYIIYEGTIKEGKRWTLKMWVAKDYKEVVNNVSYEIRIKTK